MLLFSPQWSQFNALRSTLYHRMDAQKVFRITLWRLSHCQSTFCTNWNVLMHEDLLFTRPRSIISNVFIQPVSQEDMQNYLPVIRYNKVIKNESTFTTSQKTLATFLILQMKLSLIFYWFKPFSFRFHMVTAIIRRLFSITDHAIQYCTPYR